MEKVRMYFPREFKYGERIFKGDTIYEITEEVPGFIARWVRRGCVIQSDEEPIVEEKKISKKKSKKKSSRKPVDKVEEKDENESEVNVNELSDDK